MRYENIESSRALGVKSYSKAHLDLRGTSFSISDTPISMWEVCDIVMISPTTYHIDSEKGFIQRNCCTYDGCRPSFRFSNFLDLLCYAFGKKFLIGAWSEHDKYSISEDIVIQVCDYLENGDVVSFHDLDRFFIKSDFTEILEDSDLLPKSSASRDALNAFFKRRFLRCWLDCEIAFRRILWSEKEMQKNSVFGGLSDLLRAQSV